MRAYEDAISATSPEWAPWYAVPADHKWFTRLVVAQVVISELEGLRLQYPKVDAKRKKELEEARKELEKENERLKRLVAQGAYAEFGYCTVSPMWNHAPLTRVVEAIQAIGPEHCILMSDAGQRHNPMPAECLRVFAQSVHESGVSEEGVDLKANYFNHSRWFFGAVLLAIAASLARPLALARRPCRRRVTSCPALSG